jgi:hypothetical protein
VLGLQVWRPVGGDEYTLMCENLVTADQEGAVVQYEVAEADECTVLPMDVVGNPSATRLPGHNHIRRR